MNKNSTLQIRIYQSFFSVLCLFFFNISIGQNKTDIESSFYDYANLPREIAFAHLNKSLYLKGETIGFSVYIIDKNTKKPSHKTTNVYVILTDDHNNTVKEQLIWAKEGKAYGTFSADSTLADGNYTFKAYTNWMKNFDEQNLYTQSIKIIDPDATDNGTKRIISSNLDTQFLPEGGHLVADTENIIGIIFKDTLGYGVPGITGRLLDSNNKIISNFKANHLGIGKFLLLHDSKESYTVEIDFRNRIQTFDFILAEKKGINLSLNQTVTKVVLTFNTNKKTLPSIKNKQYKLFIHNGIDSKSTNVTFENSTKITKAINRNDLFAGINIFTLFNENKTPILERVFFNYDGINTIKTDDALIQKTLDSLSIQVPISGLETSEIAQLSISILPKDTKSYNIDHNIISYTLLQPYVKGFIENAKYYFTDIDLKKQLELDNLLLTQGWSSYEWNSIFNHPPKQLFEFETGIAITANTNRKSSGKYILHTTKNHEAQAFVFKENETTFYQKGFIVEDNEELEFSEVVGKTKMKKPNLYLQFTPSKISNIDNFMKVLSLKENTIFEANSSDIVFNTEWGKVEQLDEVIVKANLEKKRLDKLTKFYSTARIDVFDDEQRTNTIDLVTYLSGQGYQTHQDLGKVYIKKGRYVPTIFWNNQKITNFDELFMFDMDAIDYIVIDRTTRSYDSSPIGLGGSIRIKTDPRLVFQGQNRKDFNQKISLPLTFTSPKRFYAPKYVYYNSDFFREYGVIDWIPNITLDQSKIINIKVFDTKTKHIKLFIEGITNEGQFISEEKTIEIN